MFPSFLGFEAEMIDVALVEWFDCFWERGAKASIFISVPELISSGRLEVHVLVNPSFEKFSEAQRLLQPNFLYCQGEQLENAEEIGSLMWGIIDASDPETFSSLINPPLPTIVYLEVPNSEKMAQALHYKGVPYIIYWKNAFTAYAASYFRQALLSVVQSSCSHAWDTFQLALASFRLYCLQSIHALPDNSQNPPEKDMVEEEDSSEASPAIKIYDEDVDLRFLVCGVPCTLDAGLLGPLEDGLNALLNIEIRGCKLQNRVSAAPPPLQAGSFTRGVVTMRCDITTCSSAHISLLVSGSAQTCFDDQLLESHIKNELIEKSQLVRTQSNIEESKLSSLKPLNSASIACGASVFEVCLKVPAWASQVLKHLAPEVSYHSLVTLGIASIQGTPVASFERQDADRLLFFCKRQLKDSHIKDSATFSPPRWSSSLSKERSKPGLESKLLLSSSSLLGENGAAGPSVPFSSMKQRSKVAAMRPIPRSRKHKILPFFGKPETEAYGGSQPKPNLVIVPVAKHNPVPPPPPTNRKSSQGGFQAQQIIPLNPLPMKKHGCSRLPIQVCSEEEFLKDVMQFLIQRGIAGLFLREGYLSFLMPFLMQNASTSTTCIERGGFYVGNGINWKGQVFSKMRNHTVTNRMTGVGNTLKRHYETYLLEYELAHDDVDGECCLLCHSSAPGDWVNCGLCGEWAHFGCDRRQGLGTFKDYAKTDGLEYICPHCSLTNYKKKPQKLVNGFSNTSTTVSRHV
uniref:AT-rich interactive domain-containing protein 4-like n=1 Tax=Ananas comosus var. bracteatus TaxID=296719 RepID=A0A6V7P3S6_ANACO|nr:unnamed protein product [Ananas comosus var. bracteatus]